MIIEEQERVLGNDKKNMLVSASAGSGKTYIIIKYITKLICQEKVPVKDFVILTFTKAAASEMKSRLQKSLKEMGDDPFVVQQLDALSIANISTIHAYCEKMLKKYANLLGLNSNFVVADENQTLKLNREAFDNALNLFSKDFQDEYLELMKFYKNDKKQIRTILFEIENLTSAVADKNKFLQDNIQNSEKFFDEAIKFLFEETKAKLDELLTEVEKFHLNDFEFSLRLSLSDIIGSGDIFEMSEKISSFKFPFLPKKKDVGEDTVEALNKLKKRINDALSDISKLELGDEENILQQRSANLEKLLLKLFLLYEQETSTLKKLQNCLSFSDLEKYMEILSEKENLFDGIKYVFIDEYQDTNKIQEKIVKNIAKNSNFVAVGDVKQGIYGFRLASCEIFLKDMQEFEQDENSTVNSLKSNFRSSQKVLDFVNDVFKVCMTKDSAGVDYESTSMLEGKAEFGREDAKAINIDVVVEKQLEEKLLPKVYSVKDDEVIFEQANKNQLLAIKNRILQVMKSQIFENGAYRKCKFSDIAILFRSRGELFEELEAFLQESGIPIISNSRYTLFDEVEIKILLNWLKLAQNFDDDIAMLSVLKSDLVGFSLEELTTLLQIDERSLCEIVKTDARFDNFNLLMKKFRFDANLFGIQVALCKLFEKVGYRAYINSLKNQQKLNTFVDRFLNVIVESGFEFDLAGLINFFENVEICVVSENSGSEDAVTLTTIHNSKGLEYPIVFLAGCDRSLTKVARNGLVEINEKFGFALKQYDTDKNQELISAKMSAIVKSEKKKDFVEELMIFYVALTRAKNRLYLFGRYNEKTFKKYSNSDCDSYFDLIFYSLGEMKECFVQSGHYETDSLEVNLIDEIEELSLGSVELENMPQVDTGVLQSLKEYLDFDYKLDDKLNFKLKESVTSLNKRQLEETIERFSNDNFSFGGSSVEEGNAYHLALKVLDFDKIENKADLKSELQKNKELLQGSEKLIDENVLFENIKILKNIAEGGKVFKEKPFMMKEKICNLLDGIELDDKILVQGIIDFYVIKNDKIILIDYKYSQSKSDEYLIKKYKNQLNLYKIALENGLKMPVVSTFLLSLKYGKLIEINI